MPNSKKNTVIIFICGCGKSLTDYTQKGVELKLKYHKQICPELRDVVIHQAQQGGIQLNYAQTVNNIRIRHQ